MAPRLARRGDVVPFAGLDHVVLRVWVEYKFLVVACAPTMRLPRKRPLRGKPPTCLWCVARIARPW